MSEHVSWLHAQLRMGTWIGQGLTMPIPDINFGFSHRLLCHLMGVPERTSVHMTPEIENHLHCLLGPHGYAYFRMLLAKRGPCEFPDNYYQSLERYNNVWKVN